MRKILAILLMLSMLLCSACACAEEELAPELRIAEELGLWNKSWLRSDITIENFYSMLDRIIELEAPDRLEEWQALYPDAHDNYIGMKRADGMAALYHAALFLEGPYAELEKVNKKLHKSIGEIWNEYGPHMTISPSLYEEDDSALNEVLQGNLYSTNAYFYCISMKSPLGDSYLLDFSKKENSFRTADVFTLQEAATAAVRFYAIAHPEIAE